MLFILGRPFSTADVYDGLVAGLRANGVDVYEGRLDSILAWYDTLVVVGAARGVLHTTALDPDHLNRWALASAHITRHILLTEPDLVIAVSAHNYSVGDAKILKRYGFKTAMLGTEAPYLIDLEAQFAALYGTVFTNERASVPRFRTVNPNAHYLPHAYNPDVHRPDGPASPSDVLFVGSLFDERRALFSGVDWTGIDFHCRGYDLARDVQTADIVANTETAALYRGTKIALNHHRTTTSHASGQHIAADEAESLGPRAYEIAACGAFQLMDDSRAEAREVFGESLVTYRAGDSAALARQVRTWLDRDRTAVAAAQRAAILPHSWTARARQVLEVLA